MVKMHRTNSMFCESFNWKSYRILPENIFTSICRQQDLYVGAPVLRQPFFDTDIWQNRVWYFERIKRSNHQQLWEIIVTNFFKNTCCTCMLRAVGCSKAVKGWEWSRNGAVVIWEGSRDGAVVIWEGAGMGHWWYGKGAGMEQRWFGKGARMVHWWDGKGTGMVRWWYGRRAEMVQWWYEKGAVMARWR